MTPQLGLHSDDLRADNWYMRRTSVLKGIRRSILCVTFLGVFGCAGDPDVFPPPPTQPTPTPPKMHTVTPPDPPITVPDTEPEPIAEGHAPLVGTTWQLQRLYGDMRTLAPTDRPSWIEFKEDGTVFVQGPENPMEGRYRYNPDEDSPKEAYNYEEGVLTGNDIVRDRRPGSFSEFEDVLIENLQLLKGYYIRGETPDSSLLTIWGGYRSEEVVLMELVAVPTEGL